jgi:hypothetical protein
MAPYKSGPARAALAQRALVQPGRFSDRIRAGQRQARGRPDRARSDPFDARDEPEPALPGVLPGHRPCHSPRPAYARPAHLAARTGPGR